MTRQRGKTLTSEERDARWAFVQARRAEGWKWGQIAAEIGIAPSTLQTWHELQLRPDAPQPAKTRNCLRCRCEFHSQGAHNRLCSNCNSLSHMTSPLEPDAGGHTGRRVGTRR